MKLITLNTWGGRAGLQNLLKFFSAHKDADIFCLQEVFNGGQEIEAEIKETQGGKPVVGKAYTLFTDIQNTLGEEYTYFFKPHLGHWYGLLICVKKNITILEEGEFWVHKYSGYMDQSDLGKHGRNIQYITIETPSGKQTIINFHGLWNGMGKTDTPDRIAQSKNITDFLKKINNPYILCGDFNLLPNTESIRIIEETGLRNLISEYNIEDTRTPLYTKPERFADYAFAHKDLQVQNFSIMPDVVSDHAPLLLEWK